MFGQTNIVVDLIARGVDIDATDDVSEIDCYLQQYCHVDIKLKIYCSMDDLLYS